MSLVLKAQLQLGVSSASAVDVSSEVLAFQIGAKVTTVEVPPTGTTPIHGRGGENDFSVKIEYLANDITSGGSTLFDQLWTAVGTSSKTLFFKGANQASSVTASNPRWSGTFVVTEASIGGAAEALSKGGATFPMLGPPVQETS